MQHSLGRLCYCYVEALSPEAERVFTTLDKNKRFLQVRDHGTTGKRRTDRDTTPSTALSSRARLEFTLEAGTYIDITRGLVFGSDDVSADVMLDDDNQRGISREPFLLRHVGDRFNYDQLALRKLTSNPLRIGNRDLEHDETTMLGDYTVVEMPNITLAITIRKSESPEEEAILKAAWKALISHKMEAQMDLQAVRQALERTDRPIQKKTPFVSSAKPRGVEKARSQRSIVHRSDKRSAQSPTVAGAGRQRLPSTEVAHPVEVGNVQTVWESRRSSGSTIRYVRQDNRGMCYIVKQIPKTATRVFAHYNRESNFARILKHPHIVEYKAVFEDSASINIRMESALGSVQAYRRPFQDGADEMYATMTAHVLDALEYLGNLSIIHCDVSPSNILITKSDPWHFKLCDFSVSVDTRNASEGGRTIGGTKPFAAPEVLSMFGAPQRSANFKAVVTPALDIWSLGATLWYCVIGDYIRQQDNPKLPETQVMDPDASEEETRASLEEESVLLEHEPSPEHDANVWREHLGARREKERLLFRDPPLSPDLFALLLTMTDPVAAARPTAGECRRHAALTDIKSLVG